MAKKRYTEETEDNPQIIVGLDIGTTKIATIIGCKTPDGRLMILGYGKSDSYGIEFGQIKNLRKTTQGILASKEKALQKAALDAIQEATVGIAARHIKSIERKYEIIRENGFDKIIEQEEIDEMAQTLFETTADPGEKIIAVFPQHFVIDKDTPTKDPVGCVGESLEGHFQIIKSAEKEVRLIVRCANDADINVKSIILEPIASGLSCLKQSEKNDGVLLLDIGGGTSDIAIYHEGNPIFTKVIPIGGCNITKDIATVCNITYETAERIKKECGTCIVEKSNKNHYIQFPQFSDEKRQISEPYLAEIISCRVKDGILKHVLNVLNSSGYANIVKSVVITGGGSTLKDLKELCQFILRKPTRIGFPDIGFEKTLPTELRHPMYSTAIGLLKYGFEELEEEKDNAVEDEENDRSLFGRRRESNGKWFLDMIMNGLNKIINDVGNTTA